LDENEDTKTRFGKKKWQEKPIFTNLKTRFEHMELPAKLLDYFLRSNKSNINQSCIHILLHIYICIYTCIYIAHMHIL